MKNSGILDKVLSIAAAILLVCAFYIYSLEGEINGLNIFLFVLSLIVGIVRGILLLKKKSKSNTDSETTNNDKEKKMNKKKPLKIAIGLILFGVIGMILICAISILLYGRIYMYDGYEITGILWTICFISLGIGIPLLVAVLCKDKYPKVTANALKIILIVLIVVVIMIALKACGLLGDLFGGSGGSGGTCGICGGDGLVTFKSLGEGSGVQHGFDTHYRCKGCHGTGKR